MTITKNMILYFIRDMGITILGETKTEQQFAGIKHWIPEREDLSVCIYVMARIFRRKRRYYRKRYVCW